jgi:hypothetical protein
MQDIAKGARSVKNPSNKKMNFKALMDVIQALDENQRMWLGKELSRLYAAFMPAVPKKPRTNFEWCVKAMAVKDLREQINYVRVTEDRICGTDGHRIHIAPNTDGLAPGYYDKAGTKCYELDTNALNPFPPVERHIVKDPEGDGRKLVSLSLLDDGLLQGDLTSSDGVFHFYKLPIGDDAFVALNMKYLNDAVCMEDAGHVHEYSVKSPSDTVQIVNLSGGRQAVIGAMRV